MNMMKYSVSAVPQLFAINEETSREKKAGPGSKADLGCLRRGPTEEVDSVLAMKGADCLGLSLMSLHITTPCH